MHSRAPTPIQRGLSRRIVGSVMLGLAIVLVGLGYLVTLTAEQARDAAVRERVAVAFVRRGEIAQLVRGTFDLMRPTGLAVAAALAQSDLTPVRTGLQTLLNTTGAFSAAAVFHADRGLIVAVGDPSLPRWVTASSRRALVAGMGDQVFALGTEAPMLGLASTVSTGRDEYWLATVLHPAGLRSFLTSGRTDHPRYATEILDGDGLTVVSSDPDHAGPAHAALVRRLIQERRAGAILHDLPSRDHDHYVAYVPMSAPKGWGLLIEQPKDSIVALPLQTRRRMLMFGVGVLVAGTLIAWLDVRRVTAPLLALAEAAQRIARGDLRTPVHVGGADEIGTLGRAFDEMRAHLRRSLDELAERQRQAEALREVSTQVVAMRDRDRVLAEIAEHARGLLRSDVALICLIDPGLGRVRVVAAAGPRDAYGTLGAARTAVDPARVYELLSPDFGAGRLAAPLTVGGDTTGWLCVASRAAADSPGDSVMLLTGLANLASLAVENARLQEEARSTATWRERERLSRELHDGLAQVLGTLHTFSKVGAAKLAKGDVAGVDVALKEIASLTGQAFDEVRQSIFGLRTMVSRGLGLIPAIAEYLHEYSERSSIPVRLQVEQGASVHLSPEVETQLIRIIQEALNNVWRHARATQAAVRFATSDGGVQVTVEDDGAGFDVGGLQEGAHYGLQTMRERAESAGGTLRVESTLGLGTRVLVRLPVDRFTSVAGPPWETP